MKQYEKELVIKRYSDRLKQYGHSPLTLGWTKGKHLLRYYMLLHHWKFIGDDLLDFGCGFGDMSEYIAKLGLNLNYYGYDINEELIAIGQKNHPNAQLYTEDIFSLGKEKSFDYAVASGVHNLKLSNNWKFIETTFAKFAFLCRKGFALDFISNKVTIIEEHLYYADPAKILNLAYSYSKKIILRNDYMPFEFTIIVDLPDEFDKSSVTYPDYLYHIKNH